MSQRAVVVGGGHNGLAAAVVLAREGCRVTVLEARDTLGGLCGRAEFHPGYRHVGIHHDAAMVRPFVIKATEAQRFGLGQRARPGGGAPGEPDAPHRRYAERVRGALGPLFDEPVPAIEPGGTIWDAGAGLLPLARSALGVRRLGVDPMYDLLRVGVLSADDWLGELGYASQDRAQVALPALIGAFMGPRSPHSAGLVLLREALSGPEVVGGPAAFVDALVAACGAWNVTVRTGIRATGIELVDGRVAAVRSQSATGSAAEDFGADIVVSCLDPARTLLDLVRPADLPLPAEAEVRTIRTRATSAKVHLAWSEYPTVLGGAGGVMPERYQVVEDVRALERAFDDAKHGRMPRAPALSVVVPSLRHPELAPPGHHVASIHVFGVPGRIEGGWSPDARRQLLDRVLDRLATVQPDVRKVTVGAELLLPEDIEARYGASGGHLHHGEIALDRLWVGRPGPILSRHATPIGGLFLASGGVHPWGGCTGAPGVLAARAALEAA